ncbi:hypothetical protein K239x_34400 [Planctomycetes bacterium K23_9]|uniref:Uncharacterized protein n=1 Tax=Stieleria marina TaxID=1930275 RepID=A0A517NWE5_9BACT|nr:hypothetical protein K239x_34400 [Planctomycetes bacterium K23_9]
MRRFLHPIAIATGFSLLTLFQTSFAQHSNIERVPMVHPGILMGNVPFVVETLDGLSGENVDG